MFKVVKKKCRGEPQLMKDPVQVFAWSTIVLSLFTERKALQIYALTIQWGKIDFDTSSIFILVQVILCEIFVKRWSLRHSDVTLWLIL